METQKKQGVIFFVLSFAIVLTIFSLFIPESSNRLSENIQQEKNPFLDPNYGKDLNANETPITLQAEPNLKPFYGKTDEELAAENSQQKPWEVDWSAAKSANQSQKQTSLDNRTTTQTYASPQTTYYDNSYSESEGNSYVYRTQPVEDTGSRISNNSYQNTDSYSSPRSNYGDYSTSSNSYSAPMTTPAPAPHPTHMTSCDGSGC
ncbi:hypothetical protein [uncultured Acinetobacter sp.]|uniref:hypothetical protein n=1 Tax=uncultured Acinetobacter sp. TaxID=165433 RepID=UPI00258B2953|nr:hypothetical protein [uncultured Acinetobacter sp.]